MTCTLLHARRSHLPHTSLLDSKVDLMPFVIFFDLMDFPAGQLTIRRLAKSQAGLAMGTRTGMAGPSDTAVSVASTALFLDLEQIGRPGTGQLETVFGI